MKEQGRGIDNVKVHINLEGDEVIVVPVNRKVLAQNMQIFGLKPGQAEWEKKAGVEHMQGDLLAVFASVREAFPKFSDFVKYLSHQNPQI